MWRLSKAGLVERLIVFKHLGGGHVPAGEILVEGAGLGRFGRFAYARSYLARADRKAIDPVGLPFGPRFRSPMPERLHLAFHDAGPDGWGKGVLDRAFPSLRLGMPEYLALGGLRRTGDLAFGPTPDGPATWRPDEEPLVTLPGDDDDVEALTAAVAAVDDGEGDRSHLAMLVRTSADVGGARPKARLRHEGADWIAKFHAWGDRFDDPRLEAACLDVAEAAGIPTPRRRLLDVAGRAILLVGRFDRGEEGRPFAYLSAGTLLGEPSVDYATNKTYVDVAEVARRIGVRDAPREVFRRFLLNSLLRNTDDHLRNHGFVDDGTGWRMSPVFDVVPQVGNLRHVCAPTRELGPAWNPTRAFEAHVALGVGRAEAEAIRDVVAAAADRLPEFMDAREVVAQDRELVLRALRPPA